MTELTTTVAPPLTRRQAREIERRTGQRPVAQTAADVAPRTSAMTAITAATAPNRVHDTAYIERNDVTSLMSVLPTEALDRAVLKRGAVDVAAAAAAAPAAGAAFVRPTSTRAAKPASLVARMRRRTGIGVGVAASAAVLATAVVSVPGAMADLGDQQAASAALVTADSIAGEAPEAAADVAAAEVPADAAPATHLVAAPEAATDRAQFAVTSFDPGTVEEVVTEPAPVSTGSTSTGSGSGATQTAGGGGGSVSSGNIDLAGIVATASSMVGTGGYTHCDAFVRAVYAQHGITLGVGVSAQAAQGTATSNPQPGDLVVWPGQHIGIYAGNGMVFDSPGIDDPRPIQHRAISWGSPYYVTLN